MPYRPPVDDYLFLFRNIIDFEGISGAGNGDALDLEDCGEILTAVGALASDILHPLQASGDRNPARLENGAVVTPKGYAEGYRAIAEGGWIGISASPEYGGSGLPVSVGNAANEMLNGACMALGLNPLLTQSQIRALEAHASEDLKQQYLPRLITGEWLGTMNITEPGAGSDVGKLRCVAERDTDGSFRLTGQKVFISWADADFAANVCHLVLARLPCSPPGTRGLSLFLAPKFIPEDDGSPGIRNSIRIASLESKLGMHGSPTAVVEYDAAKCWMVGEPEDGMRAMFTMMNMARLGVGCQGLGVAEAALQLAASYAAERVQGVPAGSSRGGPIVNHANVRRQLALMRAQVFAARCICAECARAIDLAVSEQNGRWKRRAGLLTPLAKLFGSETGVEVASQGIAVHGGAGYIEGTGAAQFLRDAIVATIYEGTNGIQAIDLVTRKLGNDGAEAMSLLSEVDDTLDRAELRVPELAGPARCALRELQETTVWLARQPDCRSRIAGAEPYLRALALLLGGAYHIRSFLAVDGVGGRAALASVYMHRILPRCSQHCRESRLGAADLFAVNANELVN